MSQACFSAAWLAEENRRTRAWFDQPKQRQWRPIFADLLGNISTGQTETDKKHREERCVADVTLDPQTDLAQIQLHRRSAQNEILEEAEHLRDVYPTGIAWLPNRYGFFYDRYLPFLGAHGLYFHTVGTEQAADRCIFYNATQPDWYYQPFVSPNGRWLLLSILHWGANNRLTLFPLADKGANSVGQGIDLVAAFQGRYDPLHWSSNQLFLRAVEPSAPNGRLIAIDLAEPHQLKEILTPPDSHVLVDVVPIATGWVVHFLNGGAAQLHHLDKNGALIDNICLSGLGTVSQLASNKQTGMVTFSYSDFSQPARQYRWTAKKNNVSAVCANPWPFDSTHIVTQRVWVTSKDGTQIPLFIGYHQQVKSRKRETPRNRPTLLNAYGGLGFAFTPQFSAEGLAWMMQGGVWAIVCARGGSELGAEWHRGGVGANKQNTFDDVMAASQWLCAKGISSPKRLGLWGASNGGLTAGACLTQAPGQFGALLIESGLLDMLDYHHLGRGRDWITEYGSPERLTERAILTAYSPLHNLQSNSAYPATLITSYEKDERVGEAHSFRFFAALQKAHTGTAPLLLRVTSGAGHVSDGSIKVWLNQTLDHLTFFATELEL